MTRRLVRATLVTVLSAAVLLAGLAAISPAEIVPLRGGSVMTTKDAGVYTFINALDDEEKEFWIITTTCTAGKGGRVEVLVGEHHDRIRSESLDQTLEDVYVAQLLRINDLEVKGLATHGVPEGCISLR